MFEIRLAGAPCFATGCHTFGLKIATAALQPRNDTKMLGFAIKPNIFISEMFEIHHAGTLCFATGCHTFGFKIATAALRPRNDTKLGRLYLGNGRFSFMRPFCAETLRTAFQTFRSENRFVFQQTLSDLSLRGGRIFCARRGNL